MTTTPIRTVKALYHIGDLRSAPRAPRSRSYEGPGLSVSTCPDAWRAIARLGGFPTWQMVRRDGRPGRFLDLATLGDAWDARAMAAGLLEPVTQLIAQRYDDEFEELVQMQCDTDDDALDEAGLEDVAVLDGVGLLAGDRDGAAVFRRPGVRALEPLLGWWRSEFEGPLPDCMARAMAVSFLVATTTDLDGLWWECDEDPSRLRAPAGVILPGRLAEWRASGGGYADVIPQPLAA